MALYRPDHQPTNPHDRARLKLRQTLAADGGFHGLRHFFATAPPEVAEAKAIGYVGIIKHMVTPVERVMAQAISAANPETHEQTFDRDVAAVEAAGYAAADAVGAVAAFKLVEAAYPGLDMSDMLPGIDKK